MYTIQDHIHLFSVWTAARAVQRGFTTTRIIKEAIDASGLRTFSENPVLKSEEEFNNIHRNWVRKMIDAFNKRKVDKTKLSYGRMAKIIAIYLKTSVILPTKGRIVVCKWIHPPIDAYLLNQIAKEKNLLGLSRYRWTMLNESQYWQLCSDLKSAVDHFDWRL